MDAIHSYARQGAVLASQGDGDSANMDAEAPGASDSGEAAPSAAARAGLASGRAMLAALRIRASPGRTGSLLRRAPGDRAAGDNPGAGSRHRLRAVEGRGQAHPTAPDPEGSNGLPSVRAHEPAHSISTMPMLASTVVRLPEAPAFAAAACRGELGPKGAAANGCGREGPEQPRSLDGRAVADNSGADAGRFCLSSTAGRTGAGPAAAASVLAVAAGLAALATAPASAGLADPRVALGLAATVCAIALGLGLGPSGRWRGSS
jgi:hypothetical protein